jgi:hypothetical protein
MYLRAFGDARNLLSPHSRQSHMIAPGRVALELSNRLLVFDKGAFLVENH